MTGYSLLKSVYCEYIALMWRDIAIPRFIHCLFLRLIGAVARAFMCKLPTEKHSVVHIFLGNIWYKTVV